MFLSKYSKSFIHKAFTFFILFGLLNTNILKSEECSDILSMGLFNESYTNRSSNFSNRVKNWAESQRTQNELKNRNVDLRTHVFGLFKGSGNLNFDKNNSTFELIKSYTDNFTNSNKFNEVFEKVADTNIVNAWKFCIENFYSSQGVKISENIQKDGNYSIKISFNPIGNLEDIEIESVNAIGDKPKDLEPNIVIKRSRTFIGKLKPGSSLNIAINFKGNFPSYNIYLSNHIMNDKSKCIWEDIKNGENDKFPKLINEINNFTNKNIYSDLDKARFEATLSDIRYSFVNKDFDRIESIFRMISFNPCR